jgi:hypothetical protein
MGRLLWHKGRKGDRRRAARPAAQIRAYGAAAPRPFRPVGQSGHGERRAMMRLSASRMLSNAKFQSVTFFRLELRDQSVKPNLCLDLSPGFQTVAKSAAKRSHSHAIPGPKPRQNVDFFR